MTTEPQSPDMWQQQPQQFADYSGQHANPQALEPQASHVPQQMPPAPNYAAPQPAYPAPQAAYPAPDYAAPQAAYPAPGQPVATGYAPPPAYPQQPYGAAGYPPPPTPARPAPGVGPVVGFTLLFGIFGAISASNRAKKAKALGLPAGKYWIAFFATLAAAWAVSIALILGMSGSGGTASITAGWLEQQIVTNGDFKTADGTAAQPSEATCTATTVELTGAGTYSCLVDFADNSRVSYKVTVGADGTWVTDGGN